MALHELISASLFTTMLNSGQVPEDTTLSHICAFEGIPTASHFPSVFLICPNLPYYVKPFLRSGRPSKSARLNRHSLPWAILHLGQISVKAIVLCLLYSCLPAGLWTPWRQKPWHFHLFIITSLHSTSADSKHSLKVLKKWRQTNSP